MKTAGIFLIGVMLWWVSAYPFERSWSADADEFSNLIVALERRYGSEASHRIPPPPQPDIAFAQLVSSAVALLPWGIYFALAPRKHSVKIALACFAALLLIPTVLLCLTEIRAWPFVAKYAASTGLGCVAGYSIGNAVGRTLQTVRTYRRAAT